MQSIVVEELQRDTLNDALFSKGVELLSRQMTSILDRLEAMDVNNLATQMARGFATRLNRNSSNSLNSNIKNSIGLELNRAIASPDIQDEISMAIRNNVALIKSVKDEYKENVAKLIRDNVFNGERPTNIVTQIKEIGGVTKSRAKFIARDQTSKINSELVEIRSRAISSNTYYWISTNDERSRPDHDVLDGMLCSWDDPTIYSDDDGATWKKRSEIGGVELQAGRDFNCRCGVRPRVTW